MPEIRWIAWRFGSVPNGFWSDRDNRIEYMDWLGKRLGFRAESDWYGIRKQDFVRNHGAGLLKNFFDDSPQAAVADFLPEFDWQPWLFRSVPQAFWQSREHRCAFLKYLADKCGLRSRHDWLHTRTRDFREHGGYALLNEHYGGSVSAAATEYLQHSVSALTLQPTTPLNVATAPTQETVI